MITLLPEFSYTSEIQTDSIAIEQAAKVAVEIAVNWGSKPIVDPPPSLEDSIVCPVEAAAQDGIEIAYVNWGSSPIIFPPPKV